MDEIFLRGSSQFFLSDGGAVSVLLTFFLGGKWGGVGLGTGLGRWLLSKWP